MAPVALTAGLTVEAGNNGAAESETPFDPAGSAVYLCCAWSTDWHMHTPRTRLCPGQNSERGSWPAPRAATPEKETPGSVALAASISPKNCREAVRQQSCRQRMNLCDLVSEFDTGLLVRKAALQCAADMVAREVSAFDAVTKRLDVENAMVREVAVQRLAKFSPILLKLAARSRDTCFPVRFSR